MRKSTHAGETVIVGWLASQVPQCFPFHRIDTVRDRGGLCTYYTPRWSIPALSSTEQVPKDLVTLTESKLYFCTTPLALWLDV